MSSLSDEVKRQLKAAIFAKLEELGVNPDKELPDYILTILGNNKDKKYMEKSLNVFIAKDAEKFTSWLYTVRDRIRTAEKAKKAQHISGNVEDFKLEKSNPAKHSEIKCISSSHKQNDGKESTRRARFIRYQQKDSGDTRNKANDRPFLKVNEAVPVKVASLVVRPKNSLERPRVQSRVIVKRRIPSHRDYAPNLFQKAIDEISHPKIKRQNRIKIELEDRRSPTPPKPTPIDARLTKPGALPDMYEDMEKKIKKIKIENNERSLPKRFENPEDIKQGRVFNVTPVPFHPISNNSNQKKRCKFWPECTNNLCSFIHPNKLCQNFPKCSFGAECIFIHPPCRYAKLCYNEFCSYTHASSDELRKIQEMVERTKKGEAAEAMEIATPCYYGGRCTNDSCKYKHPPPCRFSTGCRNIECLFYHGPIMKNDANSSLPMPHQLKWRASA